MALVDLYIGLGSNLGDRLGQIQAALSRLDSAFGIHYSSLSRIVESESWGFQGEPFLNACVLYTLPVRSTPDIHLTEILDICQGIERSMGRKEDPLYDGQGRRLYHSRIIDIDLLFYGSEIVNTERLTVPHPLIRNRPFVIIPLREIAKPSLKTAFPEIFA